MPAVFMGLTVFFKDMMIFLVPFIFRCLLRFFHLKSVIALTTIGVWYGFYSVFISFVNEKFSSLMLTSPVFTHPVWISVSSLFPDNLPVCLNIITGAWSLYFAFRVKAFILGKLTLGLMK